MCNRLYRTQRRNVILRVDVTLLAAALTVILVLVCR